MTFYHAVMRPVWGDLERPGRATAVGEAEWNDVMGTGHLERLRHVRDLLAKGGTSTDRTRLQCFSGAGFTDDLRRLARKDPAVQLIDIDRLYHGA
ncbi:hypothetical protein [Streptomyces bambusae]|uniref:hypothetical protein n=1 Tax=Streptomyces bambusae TaxID=1550616 RepID=UPI001CA4B6BA|nr:hypothetical protein [Streptomyces bambusae]